MTLPLPPLDEVLQPGRVLSERDIMALVTHPYPARLRHHWRHRLRDAAVRELVALMLAAGVASPTAAAERVARALRLYLTTPAFRSGAEPGEAATPERCALHRLAMANGGDTLEWRTILRAWSRRACHEPDVG